MNSEAAGRWWLVASLLGGLAVGLGAFGAHRLEKVAASWPDEHRQRRLENWNTAAQYQMYHALALFAVGWLAGRDRGRLAPAAGYCFTLGTLVFSGCLYAYTLTGQKWWGAVVPIGGSLFLAGWLCLAIASMRGGTAHSGQH
jgi:uncharacterized membrane protein YgdD (TMEM256/DUF423 family)